MKIVLIRDKCWRQCLSWERTHCYIVVMVAFPQNGAPHLAKGLLWEPDTPGPLPLLPPGPGKDVGP